VIRLGITGTDTGVGKTVITAGLTAWLRQQGLNAVAMKPVETGGTAEDAVVLREASGNSATLDDIAPIRFDLPLAPAVAARFAGSPIDVNQLDKQFADLAKDRDAILVEGAGGILVPLQGRMSYAGLFRRWDLRLVIVAQNRLGVINHTVLTATAARNAGLEIAAIVVNDVPTAAEDPSRASNRDMIEELIDDVPVLSFPTVANPRDISLLASCVESTGLGALILDRK
jgi:dethiobiotin synthetase